MRKETSSSVNSKKLCDIAKENYLSRQAKIQCKQNNRIFGEALGAVLDDIDAKFDEMLFKDEPIISFLKDLQYSVFHDGEGIAFPDLKNSYSNLIEYFNNKAFTTPGYSYKAIKAQSDGKHVKTEIEECLIVGDEPEMMINEDDLIRALLTSTNEVISNDILDIIKDEGYSIKDINAFMDARSDYATVVNIIKIFNDEGFDFYALNKKLFGNRFVFIPLKDVFEIDNFFVSNKDSDNV